MNISNNTTDNVCEDCGAFVTEGKAGCRKIFEEIIAREFSDYWYGRIHRLTVDAYALQHPDEYMHSGKSFAAHLTGMSAALEYEDTLTINRAVQKWLSKNPNISKPTRIPKERGNLTVTYIRSTGDADEHTKRVREWAQDVWRAWSEHYALAKRLIVQATAEISQH